MGGEISVDGLLPVFACGFVAFGHGDDMFIAIRCNRGTRIDHIDLRARFIERFKSYVNGGDHQIGNEVDVLEMGAADKAVNLAR